LTSPALSRKQMALPRAALTLVEARLPADPFLLTHFETFYREIVEFKSGLAADRPGAPTFVQPDEIRAQLLAILLAQEELVSQTGTLLGFEMYRQAQRVMACMADEIFSAVAWPAKSSWHSLEMELFEADRQYGLALDGPCMKKLDPLLQQDDPAYRELATVYFYALALSGPHQQARQRYWQPLLEMVGGRNSKTTESGRIFEQSYAHTLSEHKVAVLPTARKWWLALALIVFAWLSLSWFLWSQLSVPIRNQLQKLHPQTSQP
jgi:type VI protein secretion system component VasF